MLPCQRKEGEAAAAAVRRVTRKRVSGADGESLMYLLVQVAPPIHPFVLTPPPPPPQSLFVGRDAQGIHTDKHTLTKQLVT